jgi:hypothetical protein
MTATFGFELARCALGLFEAVLLAVEELGPGGQGALEFAK